jgi:hypothetical protein
VLVLSCVPFRCCIVFSREVGKYALLTRAHLHVFSSWSFGGGMAWCFAAVFLAATNRDRGGPFWDR